MQIILYSDIFGLFTRNQYLFKCNGIVSSLAICILFSQLGTLSIHSWSQQCRTMFIFLECGEPGLTYWTYSSKNFKDFFFGGGLVALVVISKSILEDVPGRGVIFWRWHVWVLSWIPFSEPKNAVSGLATGFHVGFLQFSCAPSFSFFC